MREREREREREGEGGKREGRERGVFFSPPPVLFFDFFGVFALLLKNKNKKTTSCSVVTRRAFSKPLQLLGTRLIFHTGVWDAVDLAFQHLSRYIVNSGAGIFKTPAMSLSVLFVWPSMYRGVYGRFLLSQLDTAGNVAVLNVALAFLGLATRVAGRPAGGALLSRMYSDRAAAGAEASGAIGEVRAAKRYMDFLAEITGIVCAASVYTFGVVSRECLRKVGSFLKEKRESCFFRPLVFFASNTKKPKYFQRE